MALREGVEISSPDLFVFSFAVVLKHDFSTLINDVLRWPILVALGIPRCDALSSATE